MKISNKTYPTLLDFPTLVDFPHLDIGDTFTFKGDHCTVLRVSKNEKGFWYKKQDTGEEAYMSFAFYMTTPSAKGRKL